MSNKGDTEYILSVRLSHVDWCSLSSLCFCGGGGRGVFLQLTKPVSQTLGLGFEPLLGLMTRCLLPLTFTFLSLSGVIRAGMTGLSFFVF